jgi:hypothetical protein
MKSYIYIIREGGKKKKNYFKIGSSKDVVNSYNQRISAIQIGNPRKLYLIEKTYHANFDKLEYFFHKNLMEFHHRGEWFYINQELLLNKIKEIENSFKNLNSTEIKKIKSPLKFLSNRERAKLLAQKSATKRSQLAMDWAKEVSLLDSIREAFDTLENPSLTNVANFLNDKKIRPRRGESMSSSNLHKQIKRLGWSWKEFKNK